jgi:restriction system protein
MKDFVVDHRSQRQRCVEADDTKQLVKELQQDWADEVYTLKISGSHVDSESIYGWKREALQKTLSFPDPPNLVTREYYESIFDLNQVTIPHTHKLHVDDYTKFCVSIGDVEKHRLLNRLPKSSQYPVPAPSFPSFPSHINILQLRQLPAAPTRKFKPTKWYHYLMILDLISSNEEYRRAISHYIKQQQQIDVFNLWLAELQNDRLSYYQSQKELFDEKIGYVKDQWEQARLQWETAVAADISQYQELCSGYESGKSVEVSRYFRTQLDAVPFLPCCDREYEIEFEAQEGILVVDLKLPYVQNLEISKTKYLVSGPKIIPASQKEAREIMNQLPFFVVMRIIWEIPHVDYHHKVSLIACNGYVVYDDPATGKSRNDVILSIVAKPEELEQIRLEKVDPEVSFRSLKGIAAAKITELVPVQPLIQFNKHDNRFIAAKEIIEHLGDKNLATMDWQDFEHLIRELFEKEFGQAGAEVKVTQASRDRGVDAVAFDPDSIRGGKFVIQAKRYTNAVDVSAVRDLYGTVLNEGANRGILVTTSNYGRDAYDFAKDKPITLINGANLLHLLEKHGYHVRIDIKEAKRLLNEGSGAAFES